MEGRKATWWQAPRNPAESNHVEVVACSDGYISSANMCQRLYVEALARGIEVNGKICNAALLGFGSDITVRSKEVSMAS